MHTSPRDAYGRPAGGAPPLDGAAYRRTSRGTTRSVAALGVAALTVSGLVASVAPANAQPLDGVGPVDPTTNFPSYYTDSNGLSLQNCLDGPPNCVATADELINSGDGESFYFMASSDAGGVTVELAVEAAFFAANEPIVFSRTQYQAAAGVLQPGEEYTITDPYGSMPCIGNEDPGVRTRCRLDEGGAAAFDFDGPLAGRVGPFLVATGAPDGFIGDNVTPTTVTGSPTGFNKFRVAGPGIEGTCPDGLGGTIANCAENDQWVIQGKVAPGPAANVDKSQLDFGNTATAATQTVTYSSIGTVAAEVASATSDNPAFSVTPNAGCASVLPGDVCTISVVYNPSPGQTDSGAVTISDNTEASPRSVALRGESVPVSSASTGSLGLGSQKVVNGPTTAQPVTVSNIGAAPMTVSEVRSDSAEFITTNGCSGPLAPNASCNVSVAFDPASAGPKTGTLTVNTDGGNQTVSLSGNGTQAVISAPAGLSFGKTALGRETRQVVRVANTGDASMKIDGRALLVGPDAGDYSLGGAAVNPCVPELTVPVGGSCRIAVGFAPRALGATSATLVITGDGATHNMSLTGTGVDLTRPTVVSRSPSGGATAVRRAANVSARFSEAVRGVSRANFTVTNRATGRQVRATVRRVGTTNRWLLNPRATLTSGTRYTARLVAGPTGIRDLSNNTLRARAWSFRTR